MEKKLEAAVGGLGFKLGPAAQAVTFIMVIFRARYRYITVDGWGKNQGLGTAPTE